MINGSQIEPNFRGPELQYPHQYVIKPQKDGSIHVQLSVFVPETYYKFSLGKNDIGKTITKDGANITLLDITNDGATIMVENKNRRQSYDYTYENVDKKDFNADKETEQPEELGYQHYLFRGESVYEPNSAEVTIKDSLMELSYARLNISVSDGTGKTILSDGKVNDFRHYLWYRNHDMPYPELLGEYKRIKYAYQEEDKDSLHRFNPIDIVNIKARGKIKQVDFFLRSDKGHIEIIDLGTHIPQNKPQMLQGTEAPYLPILNITKENAAKELKFNYITTKLAENQPEYVLIYAALPESYNNRRMSMKFEEVMLIGAKADTIKVKDFEREENFFSTGWSNNFDNLTAIKFPLSEQVISKVIGKVSLYTEQYYDKTYNISKLPAGLSISPDGMTLTILKGEPTLNNISEFYAFDKLDKNNPLIPGYPNANNSSGIGNLTVRYAKKPEEILLRFSKDVSGLEQEVSFELDIPKK